MGHKTTIEPFETGRYWVTIGHGGKYLVDLDEYDGNGWCGCMAFQCVHQPLLEKSTSVARRCKHLTAVLGAGAGQVSGGAYGGL